MIYCNNVHISGIEFHVSVSDILKIHYTIIMSSRKLEALVKQKTERSHGFEVNKSFNCALFNFIFNNFASEKKSLKFWSWVQAKPFVQKMNYLSVLLTKSVNPIQIKTDFSFVLVKKYIVLCCINQVSSIICYVQSS